VESDRYHMYITMYVLWRQSPLMLATRSFPQENTGLSIYKQPQSCKDSGLRTRQRTHASAPRGI